LEGLGETAVLVGYGGRLMVSDDVPVLEA
jgi:hypothetical protein